MSVLRWFERDLGFPAHVIVRAVPLGITFFLAVVALCAAMAVFGTLVHP